MRSYRPEELFDAEGRPQPHIAALAPSGPRRLGATPHANGGLLLKALRLPDARAHAVAVPQPGAAQAESTRVLGGYFGAVFRDNADRRNFRLVGPDETVSNRLGDVFRTTPRDWMGPILPCDTDLARDGPRDGDSLRTHLPGLARGLPADRPARVLLLLRGLHPRRRLDVQPARKVAEVERRGAVAQADRLAELPAHLARLAPGPQRLLAPGPGLHRPRRQQEGRRDPRLPAAGRELPAARRRHLPAQPAPAST